MAEDNPELQDKLRELDSELADGDITEKGYQKRRTLILSQYLTPTHVEQAQRGLRVHSPDDTAHPSNDGSRSASFAALNARSASYEKRNNANNGSDGWSTRAGQEQIPSQVNRFQERQLGVRNPSSDDLSFDNSRPGSSNGDSSGQAFSRSVSNYAFNPSNEEGQKEQDNEYGDSTRQSTMLDSQQYHFADFTGQQHDDQRDSYGGGPHRYSTTDAFSPSANMAPPMLKSGDLPSPSAVNHLMPLEPRDVPFAVYDPHNGNIPMSKFDNIAGVLRHRARVNARQPAYWVLDQKAKETSSITWEKLASRAEKVAQVIREKSNLYRGDRVALIYRDTEVIDFAVALMGCFLAGVVAVPINNLEDYARLNVVLTNTQAHLALTTDANLKNFQRIITTNKLNWPRGVEWWKTNEFGSYHPKKKDEVPPLTVPDLAYIEFSTAPTGDLRGVVLSHRTIMHQMACLSAIIATVPSSGNDTFNAGLRDKQGKLVAHNGAGETLLSYLDPRQSIGMILGVLLTVYGGHTT
ncbi:MAG: hypothetical protein Q9174_005728, partial [Haloplaca sp. 1 TL-2023]